LSKIIGNGIALTRPCNRNGNKHSGFLLCYLVQVGKVIPLRLIGEEEYARQILLHFRHENPDNAPEDLRFSIGEVPVINPRSVWPLLKDAFSAWIADEAQTLGAALAFYTIFSLAPVLILATAIAGLAFGKRVAHVESLRQLHDLLGPTGAAAIHDLLQSAHRPTLGSLAGAIGIATLLLGASGAFTELHDALNKIWKVPPRSESIWVSTIRGRFLSFGLVLVTGLLMVMSLVLSAALAMADKFMRHLFHAPPFLFESLNFLVSACVITVLFALIFKVLPDTKIDWGDVWIGAIGTSLLFTIGKMVIGLYLGRSSLASAYGAAASLVIVLVWVYYSAQIVLLGAEFTHIYAYKHGSRSELVPCSQLHRIRAA